MNPTSSSPSSPSRQSVKARVGRSPFQLMSGTGEKPVIHGRTLSAVIRYVPTNELHPNPLNARFFADTPDAELQSLIDNISANGIHDPLIARADNVLIAGHNRLRAAVALSLAVVPVRYLEEKLSEHDEVQFIIADNLLRRHLSNEQRMGLYRVLYPDFEARVELARNPSLTGAMKNSKRNEKGVDTVHPINLRTNSSRYGAERQCCSKTNATCVCLGAIGSGTARYSHRG
jgi:ParB-like nuclease domain